MMKPSVLKSLDMIIATVLKSVTITFFLVLMAIVTANIVLRYLPITSLHWMDEIVELCFAGLVFYGAAAVWMTKGHFSIGDWISKLVKNETAKRWYRLLLEVICFIFAAVLFYYSLKITVRTQEVTSVFEIPKKVLYLCMPISSLIMIVYSLVNFIVLFKGDRSK